MQLLMRGAAHHPPLASIVRPVPPTIPSQPVGRSAAAPIKGRVPYGYRRLTSTRLVVDSAEAAVVRQIFRRYVATNSLSAVCFELNAGRIAGAGSRHWSRRTLRYMLRNQTYIGVRRLGWSFGFGVPVWQQVPPIVSLGAFNAANHMLVHMLVRNSPARPPQPAGLAPQSARKRKRRNIP